MGTPSHWTFDYLSAKCSSYWQSVLRFGLPCIVLYRGIDYLAFRATTGTMGPSYPWRITLPSDLALVFMMATIWWALMRQLAAWKHKNRGSDT